METTTNAEAAIDRAVATLMDIQRTRTVQKAADELGMTYQQADRLAVALGH